MAGKTGENIFDVENSADDHELDEAVKSFGEKNNTLGLDDEKDDDLDEREDLDSDDDFENRDKLDDDDDDDVDSDLDDDDDEEDFD